MLLLVKTCYEERNQFLQKHGFLYIPLAHAGVYSNAPRIPPGQSEIKPIEICLLESTWAYMKPTWANTEPKVTSTLLWSSGVLHTGCGKLLVGGVLPERYSSKLIYKSQCCCKQLRPSTECLTRLRVCVPANFSMLSHVDHQRCILQVSAELCKLGNQHCRRHLFVSLLSTLDALQSLYFCAKSQAWPTTVFHYISLQCSTARNLLLSARLPWYT